MAFWRCSRSSVFNEVISIGVCIYICNIMLYNTMLACDIYLYVLCNVSHVSLALMLSPKAVHMPHAGRQEAWQPPTSLPSRQQRYLFSLICRKAT